MDDGSATEYFAALARILNEKDLGWVVNQVNDEIRFGKVGSGEFLAVKEERRNESIQTSFFESREDYKIKKKEKFNVIVPYTEKEKLKLLIEAIKRLVIDTTEMENHIMDFFTQPNGKNEVTLIFYSENGVPEPLVLVKNETQEKNGNIDELRKFLDELSEEIENDN